MAYNILAEALDPKRYADFGEAALYAILGFIIVILGISFLIFIVWGVGKLMEKFQALQSQKKTVKPQESTSPVLSSNSDEDEMNEELVAVITAAIAAYYQKENKKCEFTVKRIKRM